MAPEIAAIIGSRRSGIVALYPCLIALSLDRASSRTGDFLSRPKLGVCSHSPLRSAVYDLLNALIFRLDVVMLGCFIGRAPGVTLPTVGIYGAVVEVASGLRKVNQAFNPIFAPIVAGMTVQGEQEHAAAAFSRVAQWMLWILLPLLAVMALAGPVILSIYGPEFRQGGALARHRRAGLRHKLLLSALAETVIMVQTPDSTC